MRQFKITRYNREWVVEAESLSLLLSKSFPKYNASYYETKGKAHVVNPKDDNDEYFIDEIKEGTR